MVEILDFIFEIFRVQNFAGKYNTPMDQVLYVLFFPTIIMIMFILFLGKEANFGGHKGMEILLTVAFFMFLVVYPPNASYSLYSVFAQILGTVWYLFFILFGFIWFIARKLLPDGGAPKSGKGLSTAVRHVLSQEIKDADNLIQRKKQAIHGYKEKHDPDFLKVIGKIDNRAQSLFASVESGGDPAMRLRMLEKQREFEKIKFTAE
jgi:hypothetical protein